MTDNVEKPNHYTFGKYECIDVIEELSKQNDLQGAEGFLYGNIIKYLWRYKHKNGIEDLQKARWYLDRLISNTENDYKPVGENVLNGIEGKNLNFPFHSLSLMFVDGGGTHLIRYADIFEESKSAVIHQLKKILKFPQNYFHVNVFLNNRPIRKNNRWN